MVTVIRSVLGVIGIVAAGMVAADLAQGQPSVAATAADPAIFIQQSFEAARAASRQGRAMSVAATKGDRLAANGCGGRAWPHVAHHCLVATSGGLPAQPARTITIERRADNHSELVRLSARFAQH